MRAGLTRHVVLDHERTREAGVEQDRQALLDVTAPFAEPRLLTERTRLCRQDPILHVHRGDTIQQPPKRAGGSSVP